MYLYCACSIITILHIIYWHSIFIFFKFSCGLWLSISPSPEDQVWRIKSKHGIRQLNIKGKHIIIFHLIKSLIYQKKKKISLYKICCLNNFVILLCIIAKLCFFLKSLNSSTKCLSLWILFITEINLQLINQYDSNISRIYMSSVIPGGNYY